MSSEQEMNLDALEHTGQKGENVVRRGNKVPPLDGLGMKQKDGMERGLLPRDMFSLWVTQEGHKGVQVVVLGELAFRVLERIVVRPVLVLALEDAPVEVHVLILDIGIRPNAPALKPLCDILRQNGAHSTAEPKEESGTSVAHRTYPAR